jgi:DNA polymerase
MMLAREQPGDEEDRAGVPFVGPAGRIHQTPSRTEAVDCRPWLLAELDAVEPDVVVLMGAVAAKSLLGNDFRLTARRGELLHLAADDGIRNPDLVVTMHPSSILRGPPERRDEALSGLVDDLRFAARMLDAAS